MAKQDGERAANQRVTNPMILAAANEEHAWQPANTDASCLCYRKLAKRQEDDLTLSIRVFISVDEQRHYRFLVSLSAARREDCNIFFRSVTPGAL